MSINLKRKYPTDLVTSIGSLITNTLSTNTSMIDMSDRTTSLNNRVGDREDIRRKRLRYYSKVPETKFDDLPMDVLIIIMKYSCVDFEMAAQLKTINKNWYSACKLAEFYLCERSCWTIFKISRHDKISRYTETYDKIMVACLGDCSNIKDRYYDFCWSGIGGSQAHSILSSLQGEYCLVYNSYSQSKIPTFVSQDIENKILQGCTLECVYMPAKAFSARIQELEKKRQEKKLIKSRLDEEGNYNFAIMSRRQVQHVLGDYDYSQYNDDDSDQDDSQDDTYDYDRDDYIQNYYD